MIKCELDGCIREKDICCQSCDETLTCNGSCSETPSNDNTGCGSAIFESDNRLEVFQITAATVIQNIVNVCKEKKDLEEREKSIKIQLKDAMERHSVKSFSNDILKITYIAETTAVTIDSKKLKEKHPQIAVECSKPSFKSAHVKVELMK